jgi:hypothetical protein
LSRIDITSRLDRLQAKKLIAEILATKPVNFLSFSGHCRKELQNDALTTGDFVNVLHGGRIIHDPEFVTGTWRYRVVTPNIVVVIAFAEGPRIRGVTAWRVKR